MAAPGDGGRFLVVFDFDETLVNESSDDAVVRTAPGQVLPDWLKASYREGQYNEQMQRVMAYLAQQGVTESAICAEIQRIPETPGLSVLLDFLRANACRFECVVMSDANSYFIEAWLQHAGARPLFSEIFTNPAHFDPSGRLVLTPHHTHSCPRCPDNMCKRRILHDFLEGRGQAGGRYQRVFYVGDGANDVCPCLALGDADVAFARQGFPMHRILTHTQQAQQHPHQQQEPHQQQQQQQQSLPQQPAEARRGVSVVGGGVSVLGGGVSATGGGVCVAGGGVGAAGGGVRVSIQPWSSGQDIVEYLQKILEER